MQPTLSLSLFRGPTRQGPPSNSHCSVPPPLCKKALLRHITAGTAWMPDLEPMPQPCPSHKAHHRLHLPTSFSIRTDEAQAQLPPPPVFFTAAGESLVGVKFLLPVSASNSPSHSSFVLCEDLAHQSLSSLGFHSSTGASPMPQ
jgi:hypothetical protein